jgi:hypothetical protein
VVGEVCVSKLVERVCLVSMHWFARRVGEVERKGEKGSEEGKPVMVSGGIEKTEGALCVGVGS